MVSYLEIGGSWENEGLCYNLMIIFFIILFLLYYLLFLVLAYARKCWYRWYDYSILSIRVFAILLGFSEQFSIDFHIWSLFLEDSIFVDYWKIYRLGYVFDDFLNHFHDSSQNNWNSALQYYYSLLKVDALSFEKIKSTSAPLYAPPFSAAKNSPFADTPFYYYYYSTTFKEEPCIPLIYYDLPQSQSYFSYVSMITPFLYAH